MKRKTEEDYLRVLYVIYEKQEDKEVGIKSIEIASIMKVSKPTVSEMVRKLAKLGDVEAERYSKIFLTEAGLVKAKKLTHDYRVIEVFLTKVLGYKASEIQEEAHRLEHAFSDESIKRMDKMLNNPKICPHGRKIH